MTHTLEADGIQLAFEGRKVLVSIYIRCETGRITGLLGRNGQGKSSLMNVIYGGLKAEKSVRIDGVSFNQAFKRPHLIRYLPQFSFIPKSLSPKRVFKDFELDFENFLQVFDGFKGDAESPIAYLSGGERRLIELFVILQSSAYFVMLDEPFTHLTPVQIELVKQFLKSEKQKKGILLTDHLYSDTLDVSDELYILLDGKSIKINNLHDLESYGYLKRHP